MFVLAEGRLHPLYRQTVGCPGDCSTSSNRKDLARRRPPHFTDIMFVSPLTICGQAGLLTLPVPRLPWASAFRRRSISCSYFTSAAFPDGLASLSRYAIASDGTQNVSAKSWSFIQ